MKLFCIFLLLSGSINANTLGEKTKDDIIDTSIENGNFYLDQVDKQINLIKEKTSEIDHYEIKIIMPLLTESK